MTYTEILIAARWAKRKAQVDCGEVITKPGPLYGTPCTKGATWSRFDQRGRCAQHAAEVATSSEEN